MAASLARHYGGACLTLEGVVTEALTTGSSPASLAARQLYNQAAAMHAQKRGEEAGESEDSLCMQKGQHKVRETTT